MERIFFSYVDPFRPLAPPTITKVALSFSNSCSVAMAISTPLRGCSLPTKSRIGPVGRCKASLAAFWLPGENKACSTPKGTIFILSEGAS